MLANKQDKLVAWYAHPVTREEAKNKQQIIHLKYKQQGNDLSSLQLEEIITRYWLGRDIKSDIENYQASHQAETQQALITMIYGQLLMSRKCESAMDYLNEGFRLAASLFQGTGYLEVMRRHDQLRHIALGLQASPALSLEDLLLEAAVIKKLKGKTVRHCDIRPDNTESPA